MYISSERSSKKLHVAFFIPSLGGGGAERVILTLAQEFLSNGCVVELVVCNAKGAYLDELPEGITLVDLQSSRMAYALFGLIKYLRINKPDVLLSTIHHANILAVCAKIISRSSTRVVLREANTISHNVGKTKSLVDKSIPTLLRFLYPMADGIIAVSTGVSVDLQNRLGISENSIDVIYNPVVNSNIYELAEQTVDHPWLLEGQIPVVIAVGRLTRQKGFDVLINAIAEVKQSTPVRLIILGEGEDRVDLEGLIKTKVLVDSVALVGFVKNPFPYMKHADLFVLSSRWEGCPNALIQAMSLGTAVVSTNCKSGPDEILDRGEWGALVDVDNVMQLSEAIISRLNAEDSSTNLSQIDYCKAQFDSSTVAMSYLNVLT